MPIEFEIESHGVEHAQYFQGAGIFTDFEHIVTGAGNDAQEALDDALEQMAQEGVPSVEVERVRKAGADWLKWHKGSAHEDCFIELRRAWESSRERRKHEWTVTRQHPWDPAEYIEISSGSEDFSPGAVGGVFTSQDPDEIVEKARELAAKHTLEIYFGSACYGTSGPMEDLDAWAEKHKDEIEKERQEWVEKQHEDCELAWRVSVRWKED